MSLPIRGKSLGNPGQTSDIAIRRGGKKPDHIRRYAHALWDACDRLGVRADVAFSQADVETGDRETGIGFRSARWTEEGNPGGLGVVTGLPDSVPGAVRSPEQWAIIHATHLAGYVGIDPPASWRDLDFRWEPMIRAGFFGIANVVQDLDERWAEDVGNYGDKIEARHALYDFASQRPADDSAGNGTGKEPVMGMKAYRFVGLDKDVWLPDDIEVIIDIVPSRIGNVRSNQRFTGQDRLVYHQTGNFSRGANAWSERNYLHGGAGGRSVGYNFAVDDERIIQLTPLSETTWHAGRSWWNQHSWGIEQCVGGGLDLDRAERNACALHAGLCQAKGWTPLDNMYPHYSVYKKWCPSTILDAGRWSDVEKRATALHASAVAAAAGKDAGEAADDAIDGWPYPDPVPPPFWDALLAEGATYVKDGDTLWYRIDTLYRVKTGTPRLQYAIKGGKEVGPKLEPETEFRAVAIGDSGMDGRAYVITPMLTRVAVDDLEYVGDDEEEAA